MFPNGMMRLQPLPPWLKTTIPVVAFFAGFLLDALTIGRRVDLINLWMLAGYLCCAGAMLWWLGYRSRQAKPAGRFERLPYLLIQFLFGGLFSALFIFYIKSSSHALAWLWSLGLAVLLVANEFIHDKYRRFTVTWTLFGLCAILLLNFLLPYLAGSIHFFWFYLSTLLGAGMTHGLRRLTPGRPGRITPVWLLALAFACAYPLDVIPPVPLVKRDVQIGLRLEKTAAGYVLQQDEPGWWPRWRDQIHLPPGERLYCVSSVFAPRGLRARLYHRWQYRVRGRGWVDAARVGFDLEGGRDGGFRGYSYKQQLQPGSWRVRVETEYGRTVAVHAFQVLPGAVGQGGAAYAIP